MVKIINTINTHFHLKHTLKEAILNHLNTLNYIQKTKTITTKNNTKLTTYKNKTITYIKILQKPSQTLNINIRNLKKLTKNIKSGVLLLSTPKGVMTHKTALIKNQGGEILCYIQTLQK